MSFRARIALISAAAVAIAIALAALITYTTTRHALLAEVDGSLHQRFDLIQSAEDSAGFLSALVGSPSTDDPEAEIPFDQIVYQYVPSGSASGLSNRGGGLPIGSQEQAVYDGQVASVLRTVPRVTGDNLRMLTAAIPTGVVQIARSLAEVDNSLAGLASVLKMAAVVGVLIAAAIGYAVARDAARPIRQLAKAAEHVAMTQELASRIDVNRTDEVGRLAESFNAMLAALESSREQQRRLVHDAGHELRTPLTAIRTNIELLTRMDNIPAEDRRQMIDDIEHEIQELSGLVTELVDLAAEPPTASEATEPVNLGEIVDRVAEKFRRRTGHTIEVVTDDSVVVWSIGDSRTCGEQSRRQRPQVEPRRPAGRGEGRRRRHHRYRQGAGDKRAGPAVHLQPVLSGDSSPIHAGIGAGSQHRRQGGRGARRQGVRRRRHLRSGRRFCRARLE